MNTLCRFGALAALGLITSVPALAQTFDEPTPEDEPVITRNVRVLPPEVSRTLKLARIPVPASPLIVGSRWDCRTRPNGHEACTITVIVCSSDQQVCVEV
jgi:hypothetical protein